ncbi:hypothetical protein SEVIR_1G244900v4 [Setaria viridis]
MAEAPACSPRGLRRGGDRRSFSGLDKSCGCQGVGSCGFVRALEPLCGAAVGKSPVLAILRDGGERSYSWGTKRSRWTSL